ncbi:MAG TPA: OmpA family protein, partial [Myxococcaceae bacterium]|nr:OmpA family protein [Myxococcaceae bacterium]
TLPGGVSFQAQQDAFLYNLASFLANTADTSVPKTFIFEDLNFDSGTTTLTAASGETVTHLTSVLAAYPAVNVLLVGYADSTGDLAANRALSLARAKTVAELLARNGVAPARMGTDGKGEENPVASNETEDGRARNRRLELVVTKK